MSFPPTVGRYRIERVLGAGAFASVWLGHDEALDAQVAIKVLSGSLIDDLDVRNRFLEEARILRRADSERLVRVHDIGELPDGRPYFVMSYADLGTLGDRMRERPLPVSDALAYAEEIAYGVEVINALGVIHRDLKPSNVLFQSTRGGRERLLIADLGLAKALAHASGAFTLPVGTPGYMSPEQARFGGGLDVRADVYGLGALTYHMLTGRAPGPAPVKSPPSALREGVPPAFDEVIMRALEVERENRYPTAEAFAEALATLRPSTPAESSAPPAVPPPSPPEPPATAVDEPYSTFDAERTVRDKPQHPEPPYSQGPGPGVPVDDDATANDLEAVTVVDRPSGRDSTPFGPPPTPPGPAGTQGPPGGLPNDDRTVALPVPPPHGQQGPHGQHGPQGPHGPGQPIDDDRTSVLPPLPQGGPPYQGGQQPPPPTGFQPAQQGQGGRPGWLRKLALPGRSKQPGGGGTGSSSTKVPVPLIIGVALLLVAVVGGLTLGKVLSGGDKDEPPKKPPLPQDFTQVADASGKIRAAVPRAWPKDGQESTWAPNSVSLNDAQARPVLRATPDVTRFKGDGNAPGVFIGLTKDVAQGKLPPPGVSAHRTCTPAGTANYTSPDGALTGTITRFTGCRVGTPSVTEVGLRDKGGTFGAWIRIKESDNRNLAKTILDNLRLSAP